jgi:hypothetical protein
LQLTPARATVTQRTFYISSPNAGEFMPSDVQNLCLVCGYEMDDPPRDYNVCPSCGTEYGVNDVNASYEQLRQAWIATGPAWWSKTDPQPENWSPSRQLANLGAAIPSLSIQSTGTMFTLAFSTIHPSLLRTGSDFPPVPKADPFGASRVWGQPSEDRRPSLV